MARQHAEPPVFAAERRSHVVPGFSAVSAAFGAIRISERFCSSNRRFTRYSRGITGTPASHVSLIDKPCKSVLLGLRIAFPTAS